MASPAGLTTPFAARWAWLNGPSRLGGVDLARGLAVIGMFASHLLVIAPWSWADSSTWVDIVNGRSSILFAVVAGVSISLVSGGASPARGGHIASGGRNGVNVSSRRDMPSARADEPSVAGGMLGRARRRLAVRAVLLWALGVLLIATGVPVAVILPAYGILFLLALPFLGLRAPALFALAAGVALVTPWLVALIDQGSFWSTWEGFTAGKLVGWHYPFVTWIAFVLAGMGIGRLDLRSAWNAAMLLGYGIVLAVVGYGLDALTGAGEAEREVSVVGAVWTASAHSTGVLEVVGSGGFALALLGACLLLCRTPIRWIVLPLRATGAMPLTAYTAQLVAWAVWALVALGSTGDLGDFRALDPFLPIAIAVVVGCTAWALLLGRGPLERAIDSVTHRIP